ncbi:hypothetical protein V7128_16905 [Neobacillus vireti]|uniref:hypothetical protein n=1 Tax=Neobacillus vireti TaxID=220686 RepID=UPI003000DAC9
MRTSRLDEQQVWKGLTSKQKSGIAEMKSNLRIIDDRIYTSNGTDVTHMFELNLRVTEGQYEGLSVVENVAKHEEDNGGFVFAFYNACKTMEEQFPTLSQSDLARVMFIGTYTAWETGKLKHDNGKPINKKSLAELIGMSVSKFNKFYRSIVDCGLIAEQDGAIFMNPTYFYRGRQSDIKHLTKDLQYTRLFRQTVRDLYAMYNGRTIKQLAIIYAVLPFVNFNFNVIAYNPDEMDSEEVRPITIEKLAALLGYKDAPSLTIALRKLKYDGKAVFGFFETDDSRAKKVVINPRVVYAGNGRHLEGIKALFN